jgi:hypothetical protein
MKKYSTYKYILKIIKSCLNTEQVESTYRLISNFERLYPNEISLSKKLRNINSVQYYTVLN